MVGLSDYSKVINGSQKARNTERWGGRELPDVVSGRHTIRIESGGGTEFIKIGEFHRRNARFRIRLVGATDNGQTNERQVEVAGWKRNNTSDAYHTKLGNDVADEVNIIITQTGIDADGDGSDDAHVYVKADDYANTSKVIIDVEDPGQFKRDVVTGLSSADVVGVTKLDTQNSPSMTTETGKMTIHGNQTLRGDMVDGSGNTVYDQVNNQVPASSVDSAVSPYEPGDWIPIRSLGVGDDSSTRTTNDAYSNVWGGSLLALNWDYDELEIPSNSTGDIYVSLQTMMRDGGDSIDFRLIDNNNNQAVIYEELGINTNGYSPYEMPKVKYNRPANNPIEVFGRFRNNDNATEVLVNNNVHVQLWTKMA